MESKQHHAVKRWDKEAALKLADSTVWEEGGWGRGAESADDVLPRETAKFAPAR